MLVRIWFTFVFASICYCVTGGVAQASFALTQERADKAAALYVIDSQSSYNEFYNPEAPIGYYYEDDAPDVQEYNDFIARFELDSCDVSGRKGECDVTWIWESGDQCDATVYIRTTRRNKLSIRDDGMVCDSGEEDLG